MGLEKARATEAMLRVRERSRWFERRLAHWGVEHHRVAEARRETPVVGLVDRCMLTRVLRGVLTGNLNRTAFANEAAAHDDFGRNLRLLVRALLLSHW